MTRWLRALLALVLLGFCLAAQAHESMPASLMLDQRADGVWDVRWRLPQMQGEAPHVTPVFPVGCEALSSPTTANLPGARLSTWPLRCAKALDHGDRIAFNGLALAGIDAVVRLEHRDGRQESHVAPARTAEVVLGQAPAHGLGVSSYFGLGVGHILTGTDHLLFVLCLVLLVPSLAGLLKTITAFTVAHSLTLALAALGWVHVAQPPVEATIALSILFLARELALPRGSNRLAARRPWAVAFAFGLLHGFGFAGALAEVGLPAGDVPAALLLFNLGVEVGQLAFVSVVLPVVLLARRLPRTWPRWVQATPVYAVGAVAGFWWLQRMGPVMGLQLA